MSYGNVPLPSNQKVPVVQIADGWENSEKVTPFDSTEHDEKLIEELSKKFRESTYTAAAFETMNLVPRKPLMGKWIKEGDLGFVYGERGCGKTWLVDAFATRISEGKDLFG